MRERKGDREGSRRTENNERKAEKEGKTTWREEEEEDLRIREG